MADEQGDRVTDFYLPLIRRLEGSNDSSVSPKGAIGRYQIMPQTGRLYGYTEDQLHDPQLNEQAAKKVVNDLFKKYGDDPRAILVGYNASTASRQRWEASGRNDDMLPMETQQYLARAGHAVAPSTAKPYEPAPGHAAYQKLLDEGVPQDEADAWKARQTQKMTAGGVPTDQIADYWGHGADHPEHQTEAVVQRNIEKTPPAQTEAENPFQNFEAGFQSSAAGLSLRKGLPNMVSPKDAGLFSQIAAGAGRLAGDLPYYIAGGVAGAAVTAETGPGAVLGGAVGAAAFPSAVRNVLMDEYEHPQGAASPREFLGRAGSVALQTAKDTASGTFAQLLGGKIGAAVIKPLAKPVELGTMAVAQTVASSAMEGHLPTKNDLYAGVIVALGLHVAGKVVGATNRFVPNSGTTEVTKTLADIYREHGVKPIDAANIAASDPAAKGELISRNADGTVHTPSFEEHETAQPGAHADAVADEMSPPKPVEPLKIPIEPDKENDVAAAKIYDDQVESNALKALGEPDPAMPDERHGITEFTGPSWQGKLTPMRNAADFIAGHLREFGEAAGFKFVSGPAETQPGKTNKSPAFVVRSIRRGSKSIDIDKRVFIPDNAEEQSQRWYGLSRLQVVYHEVGHAIDNAVNGGASTINMTQRGVPTADQVPLLMEMEATSRRFRPKLWADHPKYNSRPDELMADNIAQWLSNPTARADMPLFEKYFGKKVAPYLDIANKYLPKVIERVYANEEPPPPPGEEGKPEDAEFTEAEKGGPPVPPRGPKENVSGGTPKGPEKITGETQIQLTHDMKVRNVMDAFVGENKPQGRPIWANFRTAYRQFMTELQAAHDADKDLGVPSSWFGIKDAMRQVYGARQRAGYFMRYGTMDAITGEDTGGPSRMDAYKALREDGGNMEGFVAYRIARRTMELASRGKGIKTSGEKFKIAQDLANDPEAEKKYGRAIDMLRQNKEAVLDYAHDSGFWTPEQLADMKMLNSEHIRYKYALTGEAQGTDIKRPGFGARQPLRRIEGSDRMLDPNMEANDIENSALIIGMADRNRAVGSLVQAVEAYNERLKQVLGEQAHQHPYFQKTGEQLLLGTRPKSGELFDSAGNPIPDRSPEAKAMEPFLAMRAVGQGLKDNEFAYFRDGKVETWRATDPELARMMRSVQPGGEATLMGNIATKFADLERLGIVNTPDFILRSFFRGDIEATVTGAHPQPWPLHDFFDGLMDVFKLRAPYLALYRAGGGEGTSIADMGRDYFKRDMSAIYQETGAKAAVWNMMKNPMDALRTFKSRLVAAGQVGYYKRVTALGVDPRKAANEAVEAYRDTRERAGLALVNSLDQMVPFFRIGRLDVDQVVQAFANRPGQTLMQLAKWVIIPTLINRVLNHEQDEKYGNPKSPDYDPNFKKYTDYSRFERDMYYILPSIGGVRLRIPAKTYVSGFFGSIAERTFDAMVEHDPRAAKDWMQTFIAQVVPPVIPAIAMPIFEQMTNRSGTSGRPLVPASLERNSPSFRYAPDTTETSKHIAKWLSPEYGLLSNLHAGINLSPVVMDNYMRNWLAGIPFDMLKTLEHQTGIAADAHPWTVADIPFVRAFIAANPGMSAQPIEDFFNEGAIVDQVRTDLRSAEKQQNAGAMTMVVRNEKLAAAQRIDDIRTTITNKVQALRLIAADPRLTNAEKLKQTNAIYAYQVQMAKAGLELIDGLK